MEQVTVLGTVDHVVFQNEKNGYKVLALEAIDTEYVVVGILPDIEAGDYVEVTGEMSGHPIYGPQLKVITCKRKLPQDILSIKHYLSSGAIKGIGEKLAERIVLTFGEDSFRIMEEQPERLSEIKGISEAKAREIALQVQGKQSLRNAMMFLQNLGVTPTMAMKIYAEYKDGIYSVVRTNPYQLIEKIDGIGFKTADEIAQKVGIVADSDFRIQAGLFYALEQAGANGHTYLPKEALFTQTMELLQVTTEQMEKNLLDLSMERRLITRKKTDAHGLEQVQVYSARYFFTEMAIARKLMDLNTKDDFPMSVFEAKLKETEEKHKSSLTLEKQQRNAVLTAISHGLTIVTGGPGTGKTTTINVMLRFFEDQGMEIMLAAPTGRAAKRMSETTGREAQTIHRLLEVTGAPEGGGACFGRDEFHPLEADVIIVDEMSMVDIFLMHALLRAIVPETHVVLVGDMDQLPSVGPGCVLRDIIYAKKFPVVRLTRIFRQESQSDIILNAHKINQGLVVEADIHSHDFLFVKRQNAAQIIGATITLVKDKLPGYVHAPMRDIQVLTPMRKGVLGVDHLNRELQEALNPPGKNKREKERGGVIFREGDKVMQIKNNYQREWEVTNQYHITLQGGIGVFNGDLGVVTAINLFAEQVEVTFDEGRRSLYTYAQLDELELAYAVTIHKAQGSEYPAVVLPLLTGPHMLMNRNLLYTAVTRAKACVTIVGSVETFQEMIRNEYQVHRYSGLQERLEELSAN